MIYIKAFFLLFQMKIKIVTDKKTENLTRNKRHDASLDDFSEWVGHNCLILFKEKKEKNLLNIAHIFKVRHIFECPNMKKY